jgi:hypothetical protein
VVERLSGQPADVFAALAARGIEHIYVDGGITIQRFLEAGLIHRLIVTRVPVLIGSGIALFGALSRDVVLTHVATRQYASGLVQSEYLLNGWRPAALRDLITEHAEAGSTPEGPTGAVVVSGAALVALARWIFLFATTQVRVIAFGIGALALGCAAFLVWPWRSAPWPFVIAAVESWEQRVPTTG